MKIKCTGCGKVFYFKNEDYREVEEHIKAINNIMSKYYRHDVIDNFLSLLLSRRGNLKCCNTMSSQKVISA